MKLTPEIIDKQKSNPQLTQICYQYIELRQLREVQISQYRHLSDEELVRLGDLEMSMSFLQDLIAYEKKYQSTMKNLRSITRSAR